MRLDARNGDTGWHVWHCEEARQLRTVIWVDDESNQWYALDEPPRYDRVRAAAAGRVHQARKIQICPDVRVVLINPLEDTDAQAISTAIGKPVTA